jgi:hypothetical protein
LKSQKTTKGIISTLVFGSLLFQQEDKQGVCHTVALLFFTLKKKYLKAKKEELWKLKYFTIAKI